jgi:2-polyprenyl-3-methyl-5-hydroxy-6-metoxy-1,4-benzoquinol methylase
MKCPLCDSAQCQHYYNDQRRDYYQCGVCDLVFVSSANHLTEADERAEYDKHQNMVGDPGYLQFFSRVSQPLLKRLKPGARGLDFGCGPGPALAQVLQQAGYPVALYDKFYYPQPDVLRQQYDFITATEVVEHLSEPGKELTRLVKMLKSGGVLVLMTKRVLSLDAFKQWHYKNDLTHIGFYSEKSFNWIAHRWGLTLDVVGDDVVFLTSQVKDGS